MDKRGVCWANVEEVDTRFCSERCQQVLDQAWEAQHEEAQLTRQADSNAAALREAAPLLPEFAKRVKEWLACFGRVRAIPHTSRGAPFGHVADGEVSSGSALGWDTRAEGSGSDEPKQS